MVMDNISQVNHVGKRIFYGAIIALVAILVTAAYTSHAFAEEQNTSIGKQRPQADEIKAKVQTLVKGKLQEDKVAKMKLEAERVTSKFMRENAQVYNEKQQSELQKSFLKQAKLKADNDLLHRKIIQDKIDQKTKMMQLKIKQMVEKGLLGVHGKKTIEYGKTQ